MLKKIIKNLHLKVNVETNLGTVVFIAATGIVAHCIKQDLTKVIK